MKKLILLLFVSLFFEVPMSSQNLDLINPSKDIGTKNWTIVNDDVMGGISNSTVLINDKDVTNQPMHVRANLGLGYLPQESSLFPDLSVEKNLFQINRNP